MKIEEDVNVGPYDAPIYDPIYDPIHELDLFTKERNIIIL